MVVLAAGRGSRLGALGDATPKWLLRVGARTLADRQLAGIRAAGEAVASVSVVVGHAAEVIEDTLDGSVRVIRNPQFETRNNWWSVLLALRELPQDGPVAILNADLLIDPEQIASFLSGPRDDGLMAVDLEQRVTDESMKVELRADGTIAKIGKVGIDAPAGEYVGMLMAQGATLRAFRDQLEAFTADPACENEWYEGAIGRGAGEGVPWRVWPVRSGGWVEIDDDRDLSAAEALGAAA
ncbi:NTP transferase domain-containing protein [Solirubrobacter sp. CPCC 204708]|uniref:NTP transferase domain-containing protein n=1 Tax=Solirubrobacter deserti TaxID=2282478 RepID=A0ABT4RFI0_9ACTN|nr:NTP transferase domain-containing protein [Solirubrobacter deserti]MBE2319434.1 NTP transferase domain-containing protein [Solirubrobacter deserti]MDA0137282.1 NTP transferase domain-containing protein [Solirubrobacter deserti]